jgi:uncharacterized protein YgiM (DUF1202 family)
MTSRILLLVLALALAPFARADEQAFTNRATDLRERGANDAKVIASLPEKTEVKVLQRAGGWTRVEAAGKSGYVNVFHLRFPTTVDSQSSGGSNPFASVTSFLGGRQAEKKASIATTGIRGLSPEDLKNAAPDPAALAKAHSYRADRPTAERFAREGKLAAVSVDNPQGERR